MFPVGFLELELLSSRPGPLSPTIVEFTVTFADIINVEHLSYYIYIHIDKL